CMNIFFFQAEDGIRAFHVTGVQTCALPIYADRNASRVRARVDPRSIGVHAIETISCPSRVAVAGGSGTAPYGVSVSERPRGARRSGERREGKVDSVRGDVHSGETGRSVSVA